MSEPFRFRQFEVDQRENAMKIGTDSVLLGSAIAVEKISSILDVGAGTGVLSLMMAQRCSAFIDSIEIDPQACKECQRNIHRSPWADRIQVHCISFQDFDSKNERYDLIISNPPYFHSSYPSSDPQRHLARHTDSLPPALFIEKSKTLLNNKGKLSIILPYDRVSQMEQIASENGLFLNHRMLISGRLGSRPKRQILEFTLEQGHCVQKEITIEKGRRHEYTRQYLDLVKDFLFLE